MCELVSEAITPEAGTFDASAMGRGEPGLPSGFGWRGRVYAVVRVIGTWKHSTREGSSAQGQLYLRQHRYRLLMDDGSTWEVYFVRQTPKSGCAKRRWFLYTRDDCPQ